MASKDNNTMSSNDDSMDIDEPEPSTTTTSTNDQAHTQAGIKHFLESPFAVCFRGFTTIPSIHLNPIDETYPEHWLTWLTSPTAQIPYQLYQIETPVPNGRQQPPKPLRYPSGDNVPGRSGRWLRKVWLPRQIKTTEDMWVLVCLQDMDYRIKPTDITDRMYVPPGRDNYEDDRQMATVLSQKMRDFRARHHKLSIHCKRASERLPSKSELEALDQLEVVNIKFNFVGTDLGGGWFTPFPGGPMYPYPNPTGRISGKVGDIVRELENARGQVHHGSYRHWRELPIYPGDKKHNPLWKEAQARKAQEESVKQEEENACGEMEEDRA